MQEYIRVIKVKEDCYIKEVSTQADGTILFNFTGKVSEAYQVGEKTFTEFLFGDDGTESMQTKLLKATNGEVKLFKLQMQFIEQPDGLITHVEKNKRMKEVYNNG